MSIPGSQANDQQTRVQNKLATQNNSRTETLNLPGIRDLHTKSTEEIASVLANVIKSRAGITNLSWNVGENIEIVYDSNPMNQLRD